MRILLIRDYNPFYEIGASANRFAGLITGLLDRGVEIDIAITRGWTSKLERKEKGRIYSHPSLKIIYTSKEMNDSIWKRRINKYILSSIYNIRVQHSLSKLFREDYDFIWITNEMKCLQAFKNNRSKIKGKSFIELNEFNDIYKGAGATRNIAQRKKAIRHDELFKICISNIDCIAVMTRTLINHYTKMTKRDAEFLHLPMTVDLTRFNNIVKNDTTYKKPYIAYTGTFNNNKDGVDILIKAFAKIAGKYPDIRLYMAGFWHYDVEDQKKIIEKEKLNDRVIYLGKMDSKDIPSFISNADLLVLSRPDSHQAQGGFPTKLGEYLATGRPVCVTRVGEIPDYLEDNVSAYLAEPGSVESFADAMARALDDSGLSKKVGDNGRKVAEKEFNAAIHAARLAEFLETCIDV